MRYPIGSKVTLREGCYSSGRNNPLNTEGYIQGYINEGQYIYTVYWDNGGDNNYRHSDLELVYTENDILPQPNLIK